MEGMTLYNILEKVDLLNFSFEDDVIDDSLNKKLGKVTSIGTFQMATNS